MNYQWRQATPADRDSLSLICLKTGDAGKDASAIEDDPALPGVIYAVPYQVLEPDLAFVLQGPDGVCGYVLGAFDSVDFYRRLDRDWFPSIRPRLADPGPDPARWRGSDQHRNFILRPDFVFPAALHAFPSHGHIDLLDEARGKSLGQQGIQLLVEHLRAKGSPGLHLQVHKSNVGAQHFYQKLGFDFLEADSLPGQIRIMTRRFD